jgi:hypothetical protein
MYATTGQWRHRARGEHAIIADNAGRVAGYAAFLSGIDGAEERWWSPYGYADAHRRVENWRWADAVALDIDWHDSRVTVQPPEAAQAVEKLAAVGRLPGNLRHATPHGQRLVLVLDGPITDGDLAHRAWSGASVLASAVLGPLGYIVDASTRDLARFFWAPCAKAKGVQRDAAVTVLRAEPYSAAELAVLAPALVRPGGDAATPRRCTITPAPLPGASVLVSEARRRWLALHGHELPEAPPPTRPGQCPTCGHCSCYSLTPTDRSALSHPRRTCRSDRHEVDGGRCGQRQASGFYVLDALDYAAWSRGCRTTDVLIQDGYLQTRNARG